MHGRESDAIMSGHVIQWESIFASDSIRRASDHVWFKISKIDKNARIVSGHMIAKPNIMIECASFDQFDAWVGFSGKPYPKPFVQIQGRS